MGCKGKCKSKQPEDGGRSQQNVQLNQWGPAAMQAAIQEYNDLCAKHGSDAVSIKSVAKKHQIPAMTFRKRYISL